MSLYLDETRLSDAAERLGLTLSADQVGLFCVYAEILVQTNEHTNLTAVADPVGIAIRHIADSLAIALVWEPSGQPRVLDVGTGAGLPGLALKILWPEIQLALLESVGKKATFCRRAAEALGIADILIIADRAESAGQFPGFREQFDLVVARALAPLAVLAELTLPFARVGGRVVAYKSGDIAAEVKSASSALSQLGSGPASISAECPVPELAGHRLVSLPKVRPTPDQFPRRTGVPNKRPL